MVKVIGEILIDEFLSSNGSEKLPGGAPFNVASNIKYFGGQVSFYGAVGKDENGKYLAKIAKSKKFDQLIIKKISKKDTTIARVTLKDGERSFRFVRDNGADYILSLSNVKKMNISKNDIVHVGSLLLCYPRGKSFFNKTISYVKELKGKVSFDINYREDIFKDQAQAKRIFKTMMKKADILKISTEELDVLSKCKRFENQVRDLVSDNQMAFVSMGSKGSCFYFKNKFYYQESIKITPVDTTGAGDAFYSYVLYELDKNPNFVNNENQIRDVLKRANIVGALATQKKGAIDVVPSLDEIDCFCK